MQHQSSHLVKAIKFKFIFRFFPVFPFSSLKGMRHLRALPPPTVDAALVGATTDDEKHEHAEGLTAVKPTGDETGQDSTTSGIEDFLTFLEPRLRLGILALQHLVQAFVSRLSLRRIGDTIINGVGPASPSAKTAATRKLQEALCLEQGDGAKREKRLEGHTIRLDSSIGRRKVDNGAAGLVPITTMRGVVGGWVHESIPDPSKACVMVGDMANQPDLPSSVHGSTDDSKQTATDNMPIFDDEPPREQTYGASEQLVVGDTTKTERSRMSESCEGSQEFSTKEENACKVLEEVCRHYRTDVPAAILAAKVMKDRHLTNHASQRQNEMQTKERDFCR